MNNPNLAGQQAGKPQFFDGSRFKLAPVHTRFDAVEWFIWDAEIIDDVTGNPSVVGQFDTESKAIDRVNEIRTD